MIIFEILSIIIGEGSQYYGCLFYIYGRRYDRIESAIYAAFNRTLFVFPYAVGVCMYMTSGLGMYLWVLKLQRSLYLHNKINMFSNNQFHLQAN